MLEIMKALEKQLSIPCKPFYTDTISPCIVYKYYLFSDDGAVKQWRLELNVITATLAQSEELKQKIDLVDFGDIGKIKGYSVTQNGGGVLFNPETDTIHTYLYYNVIGK